MSLDMAPPWLDISVSELRQVELSESPAILGAKASGGAMDRDISQAVRQLENGMSDDMAIAAIAREAGLSLHHFHRLFVAQMGETPAGYLRRIRMDAAGHRLRWTDETVGSIAFSLGYASQAAFTRAFRRRFGDTPENFRRSFTTTATRQPSADPLVQVRDVESFRILAKRYRGDLGNMTSYWEDFVAAVPPALLADGRGLYIGLLYDDPRLTPPEQLRYDCGVTVPTGFADHTGELSRAALHILETRPGLYACLRHCGPWQEIGPNYFYLCDRWVTESRYAVADDPCIEVHAVPRHLMPRERIDMTILLPLV